MIIAFILLGICSGFIGGLLGIGGGVITVPGLYYLLQHYGYGGEHLMQTAISTSLASTCFTALGSSMVHWKRKAIVPSILKLLFPGLLFGTALGATLAYFLPTESLRIVFGLAALLLGPYFFFSRLPSLKIASHPNRSLSYVAASVGTASSLLGVGGGIFTVPILLGYQVPMKNAIGTSSAATLLTAVMGSVFFILLGWSNGTFSLDQLGYIDIPAWFSIGLCSLCTSPIGAKLSLVLPIPVIKKVFGSALAATGFIMLFVG
ncbi:MAG: sulfite exporter TauE/SafE family protein [Chlamydiia bacterium]|nr:sulfite exporter TauE/SafE family protein [Chlamydiia bacterium]